MFSLPSPLTIRGIGISSTIYADNICLSAVRYRVRELNNAMKCALDDILDKLSFVGHDRDPEVLLYVLKGSTPMP